jgi:hypothetical protein
VTVPPEAVTAALAYDFEHRHESPWRNWTKPTEDQVERLLTGAAPVLVADCLKAAARETFEGAIAAAADEATMERLSQIEAAIRAQVYAQIRQLAIDKRAEYRTPPCTNPGCPKVSGEHVHKLPFAGLIPGGDDG